VNTDDGVPSLNEGDAVADNGDHLMSWDLFISHATEDKADVARPLAGLLQARGFRVWYDEYTLTVGDNLRRSIEQGLAGSRFGVVILSPSFFAKKWTQLELDGLFALEKAGENRILPIWHNVSAADVEKFSSFFSMRLGVLTSSGLDHVVTKLTEAIERERNPSPPEDEQPVLPGLHPNSVELIQAAKVDGTILAVLHSGGLSVQAGGRLFGPEFDPRVEALNRHCLNELLAAGLVEQDCESLYSLTQEGYDFHSPAGMPDAPKSVFPKLSAGSAKKATALLRHAVADDGRIMAVAYSGGFTLQAGQHTEESGDDRRVEARLKAVLKELATVGLIEPQSEDVYIVTHLGYLWTDALASSGSSA